MEHTFYSIYPQKPERRRDLLPTWIKFFSWYYMIQTFMFLVILSFHFIKNRNVSADMYGLKGNQEFDWLSSIVFVAIVLNGIAGYMLWFELDYAIKVAKTTALIGVFLCLYSSFGLPFFNPDYKFGFRLEIIPLNFFYWALIKISNQWNQINS